MASPTGSWSAHHCKPRLNPSKPLSATSPARLPRREKEISDDKARLCGRGEA
jgi:hypothetical protein